MTTTAPPTTAADSFQELDLTVGAAVRPASIDQLALATVQVVGYSKQDKVSSYNGEQETPGYGLVNLAVVWKPMDALRLEARLDNALDKTYQDHVAGINRAGGSDIPVGERLYGVERTFSVGALLSF